MDPQKLLAILGGFSGKMSQGGWGGIPPSGAPGMEMRAASGLGGGGDGDGVAPTGPAGPVPGGPVPGSPGTPGADPNSALDPRRRMLLMLLKALQSPGALSGMTGAPAGGTQ
jgi:hypothetical protein